MRSYLDVFLNTDNITADMENYLVDTLAQVVTTSDEIFIGYEKPLNAIYIDLEHPNTYNSAVDVAYWNGSTYTSMAINDRTQGLKRSGHIEWSKEISDQVKNTENSLERYWYKLTISLDTNSITINGINLVFASDRDLLEEEPDIIADPRRLPSNRLTFINYHQAARNHMIQDLRNSGKTKIKPDGDLKDLNQFDLHDYRQVNQAAKYLALHKLMLNLSDDPNDVYNQKAQNYLKLYGDAFNVFLLSYDKDDDGEIDNNEKNNFQVNRIVRI